MSKKKGKKPATAPNDKKLELSPEQFVRANGVYNQMWAITLPMPGAPSGFGVLEIHQSKNRAHKAARLYEALFDSVDVKQIDAVLRIVPPETKTIQHWVHSGDGKNPPSEIKLNVESRIADQIMGKGTLSGKSTGKK